VRVEDGDGNDESSSAPSNGPSLDTHDRIYPLSNWAVLWEWSRA
jgi:hypothetical protein